MNKRSFAPTPVSQEELRTEMFKINIADKLEEFRRFTNEIESKFNLDQKDLHESYIEAIKGRSEEDINEINYYFSNEHYRIEEEYLGKHREYTLIAIYSFLEVSLNKLCEHLYKTNSYSKKPEEAAGRGIIKSMNYLNKIANLKTTTLNGEWVNMQNFNKIRNVFVHSEGIIKPNNSHAIFLKNLVEKSTDLSITNRGKERITLTKGYIDRCVTETEQFLNKLHKEAFGKQSLKR